MVQQIVVGSSVSAAMPATDARTRPGLVLSELWYLAAVSCAVVIAVALPDWLWARTPVMKHLPLMLTLPALVLQLAGRYMTPGASPPAPILNRVWPLLLLAMLIICGSLAARLIDGVRSTFLAMGLYMSVTLFAALMVVHSTEPLRLVRAYLRLLLIAAFFMAALLIVYYGRREVYHEQIFLVIPLGVYCLLAARNRALGWAGLFFFSGMALLSAKNTSYLVALLMIAYLALFVWLPAFRRRDSLVRVFGYYCGMVLTLIATALVSYVLYHRDIYLPSGNVEYRSHTYEMAWQRFTDSPLWGTAFRSEGVYKFNLYDIGIAGNRLPTHSDIMDLLANGGTAGMTLWVLGLLLIARLAYSRVLAPRHLDKPTAAPAHTLAVISLAAIVTYSFNPILIQPGMAYMVWTTLGMLLGLAASEPEPVARNQRGNR